MNKVIGKLMWRPIYVMDLRDDCVTVNLTAVVTAVLVLLFVAKVIF